LVYGRPLPELQEVAEPILREVIEEDAELRWMRGGSQERGAMDIAELEVDEVQEWTDGSRTRGLRGSRRRKDCPWARWRRLRMRRR